jgi:hypothetical protein
MADYEDSMEEPDENGLTSSNHMDADTILRAHEIRSDKQRHMGALKALKHKATMHANAANDEDTTEPNKESNGGEEATNDAHSSKETIHSRVRKGLAKLKNKNKAPNEEAGAANTGSPFEDAQAEEAE